MLRASFVRTEGRPDRVYVVRSDGTETSWTFPSYGDALPHDLVHLVVEAGSGLARGFWGRVDEGVDVARVNALANRTGGKEKYAGFGEELEELLRAEGLAALDWSSDAALAESCERLCVSPPPPDVALRVREILARLRERWRAARPKGAIDLVFDRVRPERGLDGL